MKQKNIFGIAILLLTIVAIIALLPGFELEYAEVVETQLANEEMWMDELENGGYSFDNPYIVQAPYEGNQLAAYVAFDYPEKVSYEYTVTGDIPFTYSNGDLNSQVIIPVVALYANTINEVEVNLYDKNEDVVESFIVEISTKDSSALDELMDQHVVADVAVSDDEFYEFMDGKFFIDNFSNIYDADGNLRASEISNGAAYGYLKEFNDKYYAVYNPDGTSVYKYIFSYSVMGRIDTGLYYTAPDGMKLHHDLTVVDDKLYALAYVYDEEVIENESGFIENLILVFDLDSGELLETVDISDYYADGDLTNSGSAQYDMHYNSIDYIEDENLIILNSRSYDLILAIDADSYEPQWIISEPSSVSEEHLYLLLDEVGDMDYPSGEHTAYDVTEYIDPDGDSIYISIFDNRQCVDENGESIYYDWNEQEQDFSLCLATPPETSRAIIYEVNLEGGTVSTYKTIDLEMYSTFKGGFNLYEDGYKSAYVANENSFEIYNADDEFIGGYILGSQETAESEDVPSFLYRTVAFEEDTFQDYVELNN